LRLECDDAGLLAKLAENTALAISSSSTRTVGVCTSRKNSAATLKQALVKLGYPVDDRAGYRTGDRARVRCAPRVRQAHPEPGRSRCATTSGKRRRRSTPAAATAAAAASWCLPCGAGKTVVGIAAMNLLQTNTLVLTTNTVAVRQWCREILDKTELHEEQVGEYTGEHKQIRPVTVATYQILTHRKGKLDAFTHFDLFDRGGFGLIVYDEVHLLPARCSARRRASRRAGGSASRRRSCAKTVAPTRCSR
jgi:DNA excision repair protein ERCC-3